MNCQENTDSILLFAAGGLSHAEAEPVRRHLAEGCPRCAGQLAEAEATLSLLALTLPPATPSDNVRQRLLSRLGSEGRPVPLPVSLAPVARDNQGPSWWALIALPSAIAAAVAAAITIFFALRLPPRPLALSDQERTIGALAALLEQQQHQLSVLRDGSGTQTVEWAADPTLRVLSLAGTGSQPPGAHGRVFWDADRGVWHFFAAGIKPAGVGKTYELWFVSGDGKKALPAGSFDSDADGEAALVTKVPQDIAPSVAAVTDEPAGQAITAPSGSFQLKGSLP